MQKNKIMMHAAESIVRSKLATTAYKNDEFLRIIKGETFIKGIPVVLQKIHGNITSNEHVYVYLNSSSTLINQNTNLKDTSQQQQNIEEMSNESKSESLQAEDIAVNNNIDDKDEVTSKNKYSSENRILRGKCEQLFTTQAGSTSSSSSNDEEEQKSRDLEKSRALTDKKKKNFYKLFNWTKTKLNMSGKSYTCKSGRKDCLCKGLKYVQEVNERVMPSVNNENLEEDNQARTGHLQWFYAFINVFNCFK